VIDLRANNFRENAASILDFPVLLARVDLGSEESLYHPPELIRAIRYRCQLPMYQAHTIVLTCEAFVLGTMYDRTSLVLAEVLTKFDQRRLNIPAKLRLVRWVRSLVRKNSIDILGP
jgi:hypothetical protein